ncbi:MAG TPA: filamentous hemagglutinin N-terminal domain-containing protein, partial [Sphingomonas sp.]|nr:filamentous hemagglutinin N-terminal domain-containing protein [Sphingomonas sp.]
MAHMLRLRLLLGCTILAGSLGYAGRAFAGPDGPSGPSFDPSRVSVAQDGTTTTVTQSSTRAVVDWQSFDVRSNESVVFAQPDAQSATLNRVHSAWASNIDGTITANGRVIIQNGNGVVFGGTARIDVGSLVATTLDVDAGQFLDSDKLVLRSGGGAGAVRNAGVITAADHGFVAMIGSRVTNDGLIRARLGSVTLAAGSAATIDFAGDGLVQVAITDPVSHDLTDAGALVTNRGRISADGGSVLLTARSARDVLASAINLDGLIEARSVGTQAG